MPQNNTHILKGWNHTKYLLWPREVKLEISNRRESEKFTNMWKLKNTLINNQSVKEEITREIRKYFEMNKNTTYQNLGDAVKTYRIQCSGENL